MPDLTLDEYVKQGGHIPKATISSYFAPERARLEALEKMIPQELNHIENTLAQLEESLAERMSTLIAEVRQLIQAEIPRETDAALSITNRLDELEARITALESQHNH